MVEQRRWRGSSVLPLYIHDVTRDESGGCHSNAWLVKNSYTVMMEQTTGDQAHAIFIEERTVAEAFTTHFIDRVWRSTGRYWTNRENVIHYLEDRLEWLIWHPY